MRRAWNKHYRNLGFMLHKYKHRADKSYLDKLDALSKEVVLSLDEKKYLQENQDVKSLVNKKLYSSGLEHFVRCGADEIRQGKRKLYPQTLKISEEEYIATQQDISSAISSGTLQSAFSHYITRGYLEILKGLRIYKKTATYEYFQPILTDKIKLEIESLSKKPLLSVIMPVYNVAPIWLEKAIASVENQWYPHWEICIADDASTHPQTIEYLKQIDNPKIKVKFLKNNSNISNASNEALAMATGEYIVLMDHDDELTTDALYEVTKAIHQHKAEFIYSDEDKIEVDGCYCDPNFKPDFAPDTFLSTNYLSHLGVIKKILVEKVGGWSVGLEGAQDYDLYLKVLEHTEKIIHIPKVLYHWRKIPGSTAAVFGDKSYANEAGLHALQRAMERRKIDAQVQFGYTPGLYKIHYKLVGQPLISIIIPFKDKPELLKTCIESILEKTTYSHYEIIGMSNNSTEAETFDEMKRLEAMDSRIQFHEYNVPFNYSQINNVAAKKYASGEHLIFLNNDIEIITPEWIEEMLMYSQQERIGVVGCKLSYPNDKIQHAGLVITPYTSHSIISVFNSFPRQASGYGSRLAIVNNYSAVTAACIMLKKAVFMEAGCFDEENLKIAYNDVDLCLTIRERGLLNIYTPFAEAYHHESISRGLEDTPEKLIRCGKELVALKRKHPGTFTQTDPYYNKNLDVFTNNFSISGINTTKRSHFMAKPFSHKVVKNIHVKEKHSQYLCIFSHFDKANVIHDYVIHYLQSLSRFADIVFVSTCENMPENELDKIKHLCHKIILKHNSGYDFGAWKTGMLLEGSALQGYDYLVLCNDSVYGPFYELEETLQTAMQNSDIFAFTDNYENEHHLQSYFVVYNKKAFSHEVFTSFWDNLQTYKSKRTLVIENEIKYHHRLINSDLSCSVFCPATEAGNLNQLHFHWDKLIEEKKFPFIKRELLEKNPRKMDISRWRDVIKNNTEYNTALISSHLGKS